MDFELLLQNRKISVLFELEQVEFRIFTPGIPLLKKSQKECGLRFRHLPGDSWESPKVRLHQSQSTSVLNFAGPFQ